MIDCRWLLIASLAACVQQNNSDVTVVRVDQEPVGDNCQYGGVAVSSGIDSNHNGVLDDDEITSTEYACNGGVTIRCAAGESAIDGSVIVRDASEFAQLSGVNCIDGDLLIAGIAGEIPALPDLSTVTGEVVVAGNPDLTTLDGLSGLRQIGQSYLVQGNDSLDDISQIADLDRVLSIFIIGNNSLHDLAGLSSWDQITVSFDVSNNPALTSLHGLENVYTTKSWLAIRSNRSLTDLTALTNLRSAGVLDISGNASLTALELPNLEKVDTRLVVNQSPALTSVSLPKLVTLADGIVFSGDPRLDTISMPALLTTGVVTLENDTLLTTVDAHSLQYATVDVNLTNLTALASADFSSLKAIAGTLRVYYVSPFTFAGFGNLNTVGNLWLSAAGMTDFTGLSALGSVAGNMSVIGCTQLADFTGLDAMTDIGGNLVLAGNPGITTVEAQTFVNSVTIHGTVTIQ